MIKDITQRLLFFLGRKLYTIYHLTSERIASCSWRLQDVIKHKHMYLGSQGPCNFLSLALRLQLVWERVSETVGLAETREQEEEVWDQTKI